MENNDHLKKVVNVVKRKEDLYILATERNAKLFDICYNHLIELKSECKRLYDLANIRA